MQGWTAKKKIKKSRPKICIFRRPPIPLLHRKGIDPSFTHKQKNMVQVNEDFIIFCLQAIAKKGAYAMSVDTLIETLSKIQDGIELVKESKNLKTYKVGNMAFRLFYSDICDENFQNLITGIELFEKHNDGKVYYVGLSTPVFFNETDCYPDCLK